MGQHGAVTLKFSAGGERYKVLLCFVFGPLQANSFMKSSRNE